MRKMILTIIALSATVNIYAATANDDLSAAINKSIKQQSSPNNQSSTLVYGGKDISKSIIASADATNRTKQPVLIG